MNQAVIEVVQDLRMKHTSAIRADLKTSRYSSEVRGMAVMAAMSGMEEEREWLSAQWLEMLMQSNEVVA